MSIQWWGKKKTSSRNWKKLRFQIGKKSFNANPTIQITNVPFFCVYITFSSENPLDGTPSAKAVAYFTELVTYITSHHIQKDPIFIFLLVSVFALRSSFFFFSFNFHIYNERTCGSFIFSASPHTSYYYYLIRFVF